MGRWRQPGADEILQIFLLLAAIGSALNWLSHIHGQDLLGSFLLTAFLTWRVSRGGRVSRAILLMISGASYAAAALAVARRWDVAVVALVLISAAQLALLASPSVYGRTRPAPLLVRAPGWAQLVRRPPGWLLPWGLLAGALVTLAYLGNMSPIAIPGCRAAASEACSALAEGYPLHWLTAAQNAPLIFKEALLRDWAQWVLISMSVLYLGWVWLRPRADSSEEGVVTTINDLAAAD